MTKPRIIPDTYTEYEDGHLGLVAPSLANVEAKIGAADGGAPNKVYTLAGPDARNQARVIFKGGPLLHAIEEAFDSGSSRIHAVRIGSASRASVVLEGMDGSNVLRIKGDYGESGNDHHVQVQQDFKSINMGYASVHAGPNSRVVFYDEASEVLREVNLSEDIGHPVGLGVHVVPGVAASGGGFWVLGFSAGQDESPMLWHYDENDELVPEDTLDLSGVIPEGDTIAGIINPGMPNSESLITTDKHMLAIRTDEPGVPTVEFEWDYEALGIMTPDVCSGAIGGGTDPGTPDDEGTWGGVFLLDRTSKRVFLLAEEGGMPLAVIKSVDLSQWIGGDTPEGIALADDDSEFLVALSNSGNYPYSRLLRVSVDWDAEPNPLVMNVVEQELAADVTGLGEFVLDGQLTTTVTIQDRNLTPHLSRAYEGSGSLLTATGAVANAINVGGVYEAELLVDPAILLMPTTDPGQLPDPAEYIPFNGGADPGPLTNGDYLTGLDATVSKLDIAWVHSVEATTEALWTAVLLHCAEMFEQHQSERFAILETPAFTTEADEGSAGYLADLQDHVDAIVEMAGKVGDRNAVIFAGGAQFMASDGTTYNRSITAACGGTMAGLEVQKSLINKPVRNVLKLVPEYTVGHIQSLIQARVNCLRFKPGRGFIIAHSLTAAAPGSDYSRANDLRAVYYGSKAAREAAQPYVGEENDSVGEGLRRLESAMSRPLEVMRDGGQIDDFDLTAVSTANDRLLGDVYVSLGIQPRRAMEMIYTTVYLK